MFTPQALVFVLSFIILFVLFVYVSLNRKIEKNKRIIILQKIEYLLFLNVFLQIFIGFDKLIILTAMCIQFFLLTINNKKYLSLTNHLNIYKHKLNESNEYISELEDEFSYFQESDEYIRELQEEIHHLEQELSYYAKS